MPKRRLLYHLYPSYLMIALASLVGMGWFSVYSVKQFFTQYVTADLAERANHVRSQLGTGWTPTDLETVEQVIRAAVHATRERVVLRGARGEVLVDTAQRPGELPATSEEAPAAADPQLETPEDLVPSSEVRHVPGRDERVAFYHLPLLVDGARQATIEVSRPIGDVDRATSQILLQLALVAAVIGSLGAGISYWVARRISRPIEEMRFAAQRFAGGNLSYKLLVPESEELAGLAESLNLMAEQLEERIGTIVRQSNEQKAVVGSMVEGVLAVDNEQRIISLNKATCQLLGIDEVHAQGRNLQEVIRNADLRRFVGRVLKAREPIDDDVVLHGSPEGVLQARGAALHDASGRAIGAVVVLNDVTEFRRLEHIRRDFVANVSHELKTPITSIKGFVETLLDGAMQNPEDAERFLKIVAKQADRLNAIIEDLLSLSRIEQGDDAEVMVREQASLADVITAAVSDCQRRAEERQIEVQKRCEESLVAYVNAPLLEQAVMNLLDNAIKYSEPGSRVQVVGQQTSHELTISVVDRGCGIAADHLSRVFERFYRVDKARSRKLGGTGLGLAIVKHIVQAHGGRVSVESTPGVGSTFTIHLPRQAAVEAGR